MHRRQFLGYGLATAASGAAALAQQSATSPPREPLQSAAVPTPPAYSVIPVVGDGKWIWKKPPEDETGYLEPREYSLSVGIELAGRGAAGQTKATTPFPVECPEQKITDLAIETQGCQAAIRQVGQYAGQLCLAAPGILAGQVIRAVARCKVTISKQYQAYARDQFPEKQEIPPDVRNTYLGDSPGISSRSREVRQLHEQLAKGVDHPWDLARKAAEWIPRNIRPQIGSYTSVAKALETRRGDCEEMAGIEVAVCRAAGIPARLVWIPNHTWSEIYLSDLEGQGHWVPVHTACYFWFGWTGAHELVIQKGDRIRVPEERRLFRLLEDWMQWMGRKPDARYLAELTPLPPSPGEDPGPGARQKIATGEWKLLGNHPLDRYARR
jgi:hypothetical protein